MTETATKFLLTFTKPLTIPLGIKKRILFKEFRLLLSPEQKILQTETKLFGTKQEEPSKVKLDLSQPPFPFTVNAQNIPITAIVSALKNTPLAKATLKKLNLSITSVPPSAELYGEADMKNVKIGLDFKDSVVKAKGKIGAEGFGFIFDLKNVKLPFKLGIIKDAQLRVGSLD
jgi:hypothetical protein